MDEPIVSVLVPVRNAERTVEAALRSVLDQTLRRLELIAVDDGSEDATPRVLERMAVADSRLLLLKQGPSGIVAALRSGTRVARAPFVARMDADDVSHPARLARQVAWLQRRQDLVAVGTLVESFVDHGSLSDGWRRYESWLNSRVSSKSIARDLLIESPLAHPSMMMRRDALEAVGGYRDFDGPEDYDLWLRLAAHAGCLAEAPFAKVPDVLLRWRDGAGRLTRTDSRYRPEAFARLKIQYLRAGPLRDRGVRALLLWGAGRDGGRFGRMLQGAGEEITAFVDISQKRIGNTRHGCPVIQPADIVDFNRPLVLVVVPIPSARPQIRRRLTRLGLTELKDYWICA